MNSSLDHLVYAGPDLMQASSAVEKLLGVRATRGGRHPRFGTRNMLLSLGGETYLEIIGPDQDSPDPGRERPFGIDALKEARLVTWAVKEPDLEGRVDSSRQKGYDPGDAIAAGRVRPDGVRLEWRLSLPENRIRAGNGVVPFLIDWGSTPHPAVTAAPGCRLVALRAEHPEPDQVNAMLDALGVDLELRRGTRPRLIATVDSPMGRVELS